MIRSGFNLAAFNDSDSYDMDSSSDLFDRLGSELEKRLLNTLFQSGPPPQKDFDGAAVGASYDSYDTFDRPSSDQGIRRESSDDGASCFASPVKAVKGEQGASQRAARPKDQGDGDSPSAGLPRVSGGGAPRARRSSPPIEPLAAADQLSPRGLQPLPFGDGSAEAGGGVGLTDAGFPNLAQPLTFDAASFDEPLPKKAAPPAPPASAQRKRPRIQRGAYKCSLCGLPKKNHKCKYSGAGRQAAKRRKQAGIQMTSTATQAAMDPHMTVLYMRREEEAVALMKKQRQAALQLQHRQQQQNRIATMNMVAMRQAAAQGGALHLGLQSFGPVVPGAGCLAGGGGVFVRLAHGPGGTIELRDGSGGTIELRGAACGGAAGAVGPAKHLLGAAPRFSGALAPGFSGASSPRFPGASAPGMAFHNAALPIGGIQPHHVSMRTMPRGMSPRGGVPVPMSPRGGVPVPVPVPRAMPQARLSHAAEFVEPSKGHVVERV